MKTLAQGEDRKREFEGESGGARVGAEKGTGVAGGGGGRPQCHTRNPALRP